MINLALSFAAGLAVVVLVKLLGFGLLAGIIPGTIVFLAIFVVLGRRSFMQLQAVVQKVQAELQSMTPNKKEQATKVDKAIKMLEAALPLIAERAATAKPKKGRGAAGRRGASTARSGKAGSTADTNKPAARSNTAASAKKASATKPKTPRKAK